MNAAASNPSDNNALYERLAAPPQHARLMTRLHHATQQGELRADADHDAIANALIGTLLLKLLSSTAPGDGRATRFDGLLDAILQGASGVACEGGG